MKPAWLLRELLQDKRARCVPMDPRIKALSYVLVERPFTVSVKDTFKVKGLCAGEPSYAPCFGGTLTAHFDWQAMVRTSCAMKSKPRLLFPSLASRTARRK